MTMTLALVRLFSVDDPVGQVLTFRGCKDTSTGARPITYSGTRDADGWRVALLPSVFDVSADRLEYLDGWPA
jgi:hypothetical protein